MTDERRSRRRDPRVYRRRRIVLGVLGVLVLGLLAGAAWLGLGLKSSASAIQSDASAAQSSIEAAKAQLLAGDFDAASASAAKAKAQVAEAAQAAQARPVRVAAALPVAGQAVSDLDNLIGAASDLAAATGDIVTVYGAATGKAAKGPQLFAGGQVNFHVLDDTATAVDKALATITAAEGKLQAVQGSLPGTGSMAAARDKALAQTGPLKDTLVTMQSVMKQMPAALGQDGTKRYLLVTLNPAELYASGGAALSAAVIKFTDGIMTIPVRGSVSSKLFPGNPKVKWDHVAKLPYYRHNAPAAFAYSDLHPDFTIAAQDIQRAWVASGMRSVDGVISLDPTALQAALKVTGPVSNPVYGEVTAENLVQKLLVDAYVDFKGDQKARHALNDQLVNAVFDRLSGGSGALSLAKALASTAPGHHFRIYVNNAELQKTIVSSGLSGEFPAATPEATGDTLAVFTQNQNGSKTGIFQTRAVAHTVTIKADGSATVKTVVKATFDVPMAGRSTTDREGYTTPWSFDWYLAYVPSKATAVRITAPENDPEDLNDPARYPGENDRDVVRVGRWTEGGGSTTVTVTYALPAGTFGGNGSPLRYSLTTMPQPMTHDATATVSVTAPGAASIVSAPTGWTVAGSVASYRGPFSEVTLSTLEWR